jgi:hypothetical protein
VSAKNVKKAKLVTVGWREWAALPELGVAHIKVKVDTGARTSALHAFNLKTFTKEGASWVGFEVHPVQHSQAEASYVEMPIIDWRKVKSSNGRSERRPVIRTVALLGEQAWDVELTLTRRDLMSFRMLLGRQALSKRALVDVSKSYLLAAPQGAEVIP